MPSDLRLRPLNRLVLLMLALTAMTAGPAARLGAGTLVERTEAFVNRRPVLLSDVVLTAALLRLNHAEATEKSIDEALMFEEASRLVNDAPGDEAVTEATLSLKEKAGPGFSTVALRRKALVQLTIAAYIDLRLRSLVRVEDEDVRKAFEDLAKTEARSPIYADVVADLREALEARVLDERIEEWVAELRLRADIRRPPVRTPEELGPGD